MGILLSSSYPFPLLSILLPLSSPSLSLSLVPPSFSSLFIFYFPFLLISASCFSILLSLPYIIDALSIPLVVDCGQLQDPANGIVKFGGTTVGSMATYACNKGFTLMGSNARVCQPNGKWSRDEPICSCEYLSLQICMCLCMYVCMYVYTYQCMYACNYVCICMYMYVYMYSCTYICTYIPLSVFNYVYIICNTMCV